MKAVSSQSSMIFIFSTFLCFCVSCTDALAFLKFTEYTLFASSPHRTAPNAIVQCQSTTPQQNDCCDQEESPKSSAALENSDAILLAPSDPRYSTFGPIGLGDFIISREGPPTKEELANENLLKIVLLECSDLEVNTLVWKCLGYRFHPKEQIWTNDECFEKWREKHPMPPDMIGMQRVYSKDIDGPSLKANQDLVRSIPAEHKQQLKLHFIPLGWKGYLMDGLTPNKTRRAQCTNWLLFFREELFGYTVEELKKRRQNKSQ